MENVSLNGVNIYITGITVEDKNCNVLRVRFFLNVTVYTAIQICKKLVRIAQLFF